MKNYIVSFQYSKDGVHWQGATRTIKADSDVSAMMQVENMYPYVRNIKISR